MTNTQEIKEILDNIKSLNNDFAEIKTDIKSMQSDISELKTGQAVLINDGKWIKILYGVFSSIIMVLLATLIQYQK
ncbi:MAG: hypothetical protein AAGF26_16860 [Cyanobacteria bacterium P01_G01_bin.49]